MGTTKHIHFRSLFFALTTMLVTSSLTTAFADSGEKPPLNPQALAQVATKEFQADASILVHGYGLDDSPHKIDRRSAERNSVGNERFEQAVERYRKELAGMGETYCDSRTNTVINSTTHQRNGTVKAIVTETTYLTICSNSTETGYETHHALTFSPLPGGKWEVIKDQYLEPTGLLPLEEAQSLVEGNAESFDDAKTRLSLEGATPASTERLDEANKQVKETFRAKGYNYAAMASYLERYWNKYNPAYRSFKGNGGDCTNFVSQALRAGGWKDKPGWFRNANYWWYSRFNQSRSWTSVEYWATFARSSGRTSMLSNVWQLRKGDVLQVKPKNSNQKIHTMMVSYYSNGVPYFTYHSANRYRRSLNQVLLDWKGGVFYAYRT